ncbi:MAG: hypothetical protein MI923_13335, partial [Phycisphaerales bacterium]|nr:hypothetical protein [Phycisphaerales bacterium]
MNPSPIETAFIALAIALPLPAHADYSFVNIIDTDDRTFSQSLPIFDFGSPTLNNERQVASNIRKPFITGDHSLILWEGGAFQEVVPTQGNQRLVAPAINDSGQIAFNLIDDDEDTEKILRYNPDTTTTTIAQTTASGFTGFPSFHPSTIDNQGRVGFWAETDTTEGIYLGDGTATTTIAETGAQFESIDLFFALNNSGTVAFTGRTGSTRSSRGVFTSDGTTTDTIFDGSDGTFDAFTCRAVNDTGFVAYSA